MEWPRHIRPDRGKGDAANSTESRIAAWTDRAKNREDMFHTECFARERFPGKNYAANSGLGSGAVQPVGLTA